MLFRLSLAIYGSLACGRVAHAEASVPLHWDAPEECPSAGAVLERLSDLLGRTPADWARYERVNVAIRPAPGDSWVLSLELQGHGDTQTRTLSAPRCDELANAAAVALAIALGDEEAASAEAWAPVDAESLPSPVAPAPPTPDTTTALSLDPSAASRTSAAFVLGAEGVLDTPTLGGAAFGFGLRADVHFARFGVGLYGLALPSQSEAVGAAGTSRVDFSLLAGGARGCYRIIDARAHAEGCIAFEAGRLSAEPRGLVEPEQTHDLWLATGPGLELGWDLVTGLGALGQGSALALQARADALLPLLQEDYVIDRTESVHSTPRATLRVALGLSILLR